jgi:hypothetical protein
MEMFLIQWEQTRTLRLSTNNIIDKVQCLIFNLFKTIHIQIKCLEILNLNLDLQIGMLEKAWIQLQRNKMKDSLYTHTKNKEKDRLISK